MNFPDFNIKTDYPMAGVEKQKIQVDSYKDMNAYEARQLAIWLLQAAEYLDDIPYEGN